MEKFSSNVIILFVASSASKLIPAIRSRCIHLRVPLADDAAIRLHLEQRGLTPSAEMLDYCNGSLKVAATIHDGFSLENAHGIHAQCKAISGLVLKSPSVNCLYEIRRKLMSVLSVGYKAEFILEFVVADLVKQMRPAHAAQLFSLASEMAARLNNSNKEIFHLEAFVAKTMALVARQ